MYVWAAKYESSHSLSRRHRSVVFVWSFYALVHRLKVNCKQCGLLLRWFSLWQRCVCLCDVNGMFSPILSHSQTHLCVKCVCVSLTWFMASEIIQQSCVSHVIAVNVELWRHMQTLECYHGRQHINLMIYLNAFFPRFYTEIVRVLRKLCLVFSAISSIFATITYAFTVWFSVYIKYTGPVQVWYTFHTFISNSHLIFKH